MSKPYTVQPGDNLTTIARRFRLSSWQQLYNSPDNAGFRAKRPNPNLIFPGDIIMVPDGSPPAPPARTPTPPTPIPPPALRGILRIWINAFIPGDVPGYTINIVRGTNSGKTAIPLPALARLNPLNTLKDWNAGYLTDQRTFSTLPSASVRVQSLAEILLPDATVVRASHTSSGTTQVNTESGDTTGFAVADTSRCTWGTLTYLSIKVKGQASDPLVSAAADIDYEGLFNLTPDPGASRLTVDFDGKLDAFPAFEAYASFSGITKALFTVPPPSGNTVTNLLGGANRPIRGSASFP